MTLTLDHDPLDPRAPVLTVPPSGDASPTPAVASERDVVLRLRWWRQIVLVLAFYGAYSFVRGQFGLGAVSASHAAANATTIMDLEQHLGIGNELALQQWFLQWPWLVRLLNIFYGLFHFAVPILTLVILFRSAPSRYRRWRDTLAAATALALIGFSVFPLMPPRLLCACPAGSGIDSGFVDTLARYGGLWSFGSHGVGAVSNQYAAMPSLHFAWALWCALAARAVLPRGRRLVFAYPAVTLLVIVVTGNHFWLDAVGGIVVIAAGSGCARVLERGRREARATRVEDLVPQRAGSPQKG